MQTAFVSHHHRLLDIYRALLADPQALSPDDRVTRLRAVRDAVLRDGTAASLVIYERYLNLIALRLGQPALLLELALPGVGESLPRFRRDPSDPGALIQLALACLREGARARGRHLLRRMAGSGYPEADLARGLLASALQTEEIS